MSALVSRAHHSRERSQQGGNCILRCLALWRCVSRQINLTRVRRQATGGAKLQNVAIGKCHVRGCSAVTPASSGSEQRRRPLPPTA
jgi:hypothetical protein